MDKQPRQRMTRWSQLEENCPIDLTRVKHHYQDFMSQNYPIAGNSIMVGYAKESVIQARKSLFLLINSILQTISDGKVVRRGGDFALYDKLTQNLSRLINFISTEEYSLIVVNDNPDETKSKVGISSISSYSQTMENVAESIYEAIISATTRYVNHEETKDMPKNTTTFFYFLFEALQITFVILGGYAPKGSGQVQQKQQTTYNLSSEVLQSNEGQEQIRKEYEKEKGRPLPDIKFEDFQETGVEDEDTI